MTNATHITYLFDPLCGWCYGASPVMDKLSALPDFTIQYIPTGLFAGEGARPMDAGFAAYAWSNDQRISRLTGQVFSEDYRRRILADHTHMFDSGPATLAITAVALFDAARVQETIKAIQHARYVEGRDTTNMIVLADILKDLDLEKAAERILAPDKTLHDSYRQNLQMARTAMHRFNIQGVPALIVGTSKNRRALGASALFTDMATLLASLKNT
ncbi:MAG: DsbA family protein [Pseudomonadota bacterium]